MFGAEERRYICVLLFLDYKHGVLPALPCLMSGAADRVIPIQHRVRDRKGAYQSMYSGCL